MYYYGLQPMPLNVTRGCSHHKCKFCDIHAGENFKVTPMEQLEQELEAIQRYQPNTKQIYFTGEDPFVLSYEKIKLILQKAHEKLPYLQIVTMTARVSNMKNKTVEQLTELRKLGIYHLWLGSESGNDEVLRNMNKKLTAEDILVQCKKLETAKINYTLSYVIGLGGAKLSEENALDTAQVYNQLQPAAIAMSGLMVFRDTALYQELKNKSFDMATESQLAHELKLFLEHLDTYTEINTNHTSPIIVSGIYPRDKSKILAMVQDKIDHYDFDKHAKNRIADSIYSAS